MTVWLHAAHRAVITLGGPDRLAFLDRLVTADLRDLDGESHNGATANSTTAPTRIRWTALLSAQGAFRFECFVVVAGDQLLLDCDRDQMVELGRALAGYVTGDRIQLAPCDRQVLVAPPAPNAAPATMASPRLTGGLMASPRMTGGLTVPDPRSPLLGHRCYVSAADLAQAAPHSLPVIPRTGAPLPSTDPAWPYEQVRVSLGIGDGLADLVPMTGNPLDYGLDLWNALSYKKGCYVGQEVAARMHFRKRRPWRLATFVARHPEQFTERPRVEAVEPVEAVEAMDRAASAAPALPKHLAWVPKPAHAAQSAEPAQPMLDVADAALITSPIATPDGVKFLARVRSKALDAAQLSDGEKKPQGFFRFVSDPAWLVELAPDGWPQPS